MITSEICCGCTPVRASSALMMWAPRSDAGTLPKDPLNFPTAVRSAAVITTSFIRLLLLLQNVFPGRIGEQNVAGGGAAHGRRSEKFPSGMLCEPLLPDRPPGAQVRFGRLEPCVRRERIGCIEPGADSMAPARMHGTAHDAGVVAARCQKERVVARVRQSARFVDRAPRRDMIGFRPDHEHGQANRAEIDAAALGHELAA